MMPAHALIVHRIPGRVRLRVDERRGDSAYFCALLDEFSGMDMVRNVKTNPGTGSVVIEFSDTLDNLVQQLQEHDLVVNDAHASDERTRPAPAGMDTQPINLVSGREIDPMFMLGALLAMIGVVQTFRGRILIPAMTAFWYAADVFRRSRQTHQ